MSLHLDLGRRAEEFAVSYVESLRWKILGRNISNSYGELDIVAIDKVGKELVIVEVRYRTIGDVQSPLESVGPKKLKTLVRAGRSFVDSIGWEDAWRIDLVGITANPKNDKGWTLEHIQDITGGDYPS